MTSIHKLIRAGALGLALVGATFAPTKQAHADGGAVIAAIGGGLILGSILGSAAQAQVDYDNSRPYYAPAQPAYAPAQPAYAPAQPYYAPAQTYYAPAAPAYVAPRYYYPPVSFGVTFGTGYYGRDRHYRGRHHRGHRGYRGRGGHRGHGHHRRGHR